VVALWRLTPGGAEAIALSVLERVATHTAGAAEVFRAPYITRADRTGLGGEGLMVPPDPESSSWLPGRYVFGMQETSISAYAYFGVEIANGATESGAR
jgi:hypothetical protein